MMLTYQISLSLVNVNIVIIFLLENGYNTVVSTHQCHPRVRQTFFTLYNIHGVDQKVHVTFASLALSEARFLL